MRGERGAVLAQALIFVAVAALIGAGILHARLQPALTAARAAESVRGGLSARAALARVREVWARGGTCASDESRGVSCAGGGCSCACEVTVPGVPETTVSAEPDGGACALTAAER
jgi:hypothetical protein